MKPGLHDGEERITFFHPLPPLQSTLSPVHQVTVPHSTVAQINFLPENSSHPPRYFLHDSSLQFLAPLPALRAPWVMWWPLQHTTQIP